MVAIQSLPEPVARAIAAGEAIDSLAAAVRELAENAIDAGATRLAIAIATDTLSVRVCDNGTGMDADDLLRAASPHATSKIRTTADLHGVTTLGFRGEALHALAQLADLRIASRTPTAPGGLQVTYDRQGVPLAPPQDIAIAPGTIVEVQRLFAARPERLALLPSVPQQLRGLQQQLYHLAIAHPHVAWQVSVDGSAWLTLWAGATVADILPQVVRSLEPQDLVTDTWADTEGSTLRLTLALPDRASRRRPDWVKAIVNGRCVAFPELERVLLAAFARTLPRHRYPIAVLSLTVPPQDLDWNRKSDKSEVYLNQLETWQERVKALADRVLHAPTRAAKSPRAVTRLLRAAEAGVAYHSGGEGSEAAFQPSPRDRLTVLAQVLGTYILAERAAGLCLIEQHVAHERILFEALEAQWQIVPLTPPLLVDDLIDAGAERLQEAGLELEPFGDRVWIVRSLPALLVDREDAAAILRELAQQEDARSLVATVACRSAIRNGTPLDRAAMQDLVDRWQRTAHPHTCPHGRPICLALNENDLARFFRRNWIVRP